MDREQVNKGSFARLWQIRSTIKKYGLTSLLDQLKLTPGASLAVKLLFGRAKVNQQPRAERIRLALESLGPVFVKLGQALSTRPDLLPVDIALELTKLQDQVPPFSGSEAVEIIRQQLAGDFETTFVSVDESPLASASVAQVHTAELVPELVVEGKNKLKNEQVVIKVIRPGIEQQIEKDLAVMRFAARLLDKYWQRAKQFKPIEIIRDYENTILGELDLRREAANCSQMGANFADSDLIYVPQVYWDLTSRRVMVMERIYGTSVRDVDTLKAKGHDLKQLASDGVETFFKQAFVDNFFHADMHPGNIFVSNEGRWIAIDFGIMGVLTDYDKRYLAEMLLGFFNRDYRSIAQSHLRAGWIPENTQLAEFEAAIRMVCEPNFAKPISEISFGLVLLQLVETVQRFEMPVQPQLVLLYKTLLNIEGLGRQLYPQLNLWDTAKPFLEEWMKQQLSPQALLADLKRDWPLWRETLATLPELIEKAKHYDPRLEQERFDLLQQEQQKNRRAKFHLWMGFGVAYSAIAVYLAARMNFISAPSDSPWLLALAGLGVLWAYVKNCKN